MPYFDDRLSISKELDVENLVGFSPHYYIFSNVTSEIPCKKYLVRNVDIAKKKDGNFADITKGICLFLHAAGNKLPVNASFLFDSDACIAKIN